MRLNSTFRVGRTATLSVKKNYYFGTKTGVKAPINYYFSDGLIRFNEANTSFTALECILL